MADDVLEAAAKGRESMLALGTVGIVALVVVLVVLVGAFVMVLGRARKP